MLQRTVTKRHHLSGIPTLKSASHNIFQGLEDNGSEIKLSVLGLNTGAQSMMPQGLGLQVVYSSAVRRGKDGKY